MGSIRFRPPVRRVAMHAALIGRATSIFVRGMFANAQCRSIEKLIIITTGNRWRTTTLCCVRKLNDKKGREKMSIGLILLIVLVPALVGVIPTWSRSRQWGYGPSGGVGLILVIVSILFLRDKI